MNDLFRRFANWTSLAMGSSWAFSLALVFTLIWLVSGFYFDFNETWNFIANTSTTVLTFLAVFLIQNTQNRDARAIHAKLDELIYALSEARNELIDLESETDEKVGTFKEELRSAAKEGAEEGAES